MSSKEGMRELKKFWLVGFFAWIIGFVLFNSWTHRWLLLRAVTVSQERLDPGLADVREFLVTVLL